jgi:hypothetical protein
MRTITLADDNDNLWRYLPQEDMSKLLRAGMVLMQLITEKKIWIEPTDTAFRIHPLKPQFAERDF